MDKLSRNGPSLKLIHVRTLRTTGWGLVLKPKAARAFLPDKQHMQRPRNGEKFGRILEELRETSNSQP